jgi:exodeoxyribonuclease VII small subunit
VYRRHLGGCREGIFPSHGRQDAAGPAGWKPALPQEMEKTFESSLNQLETIVKQLEQGDLPLEDSLKLFEKGVALSRECRERLHEAERRIEILMKDSDGEPAVSELDPASLRGERNAKRIVFSENDDDQPF